MLCLLIILVVVILVVLLAVSLISPYLLNTWLTYRFFPRFSYSSLYIWNALFDGFTGNDGGLTPF